MAEGSRFNIPAQNPLTRIGYCMYCLQGEPYVKLTDEHVIPLSFGGHRYLPDATCEGCARNTSEFIGHCCSTMLAALRLHHGIRGNKKRPLKTEITVAFVREGGQPTEFEKIHKDQAPGIAVFPFFDFPGIMFDRAMCDSIQPLGFGAYHTTSDTEERAKRLSDEERKALATGLAAPYEFAKVLAQIAYGYYVEHVGVPNNSPLPPIVMGEDLRLSHWIGGTPEIAVRVPPPTSGNRLHHVSAVNYLIDGVGYLAVQIRLFSYLDPHMPVYSVIAGRREIPKGEEYFAFTSNKTANGMYVEGPLMMTKSEPIPLVGLIPAIIATWINRLHLFVKRHGGCLYGIVARRHTRNLPSIARRIN